MRIINNFILLTMFTHSRSFYYTHNTLIKYRHLSIKSYVKKDTLNTNFTTMYNSEMECNLNNSYNKPSKLKLYTDKIQYISIYLLLGIIYSELFKINGSYLNSITFFKSKIILKYYLIPLFLTGLYSFIYVDYDGKNKNIDRYVCIISSISLLYIFYFEYFNDVSVINSDDRVMFKMAGLYIDILSKLNNN